MALPVLGWAIDRAGARRVVRIGMALVGATVLLAIVPTRGIQAVALAATGGLGLVGVYLPMLAALNNWFHRQLVVALAALLFALAIASAIVDFALPLFADVVDWRIVMVAGGLVVLAVTPALSGAIRDHPEDIGEPPDGLTVAPDDSVPNYTWRDALWSRQFWTLVAALCCMSAVESVSYVCAAPLIVNRGVEIETVRHVRELDRYLTIPFILAGGLIGYRWHVRYMLAGVAIVTAIGIGMMSIGHTLEFLIASLLLAAASGCLVAPGLAAVATYFGRRNFASITATIMLLKYLVDFAILPTVGWFGAVPFGGYSAVAVASAVLSLTGAVLFWKLGQPRLSPSQSGGEPAISC